MENVNLGDLTTLGITGQQHEDGTLTLCIPGLDAGQVDLRSADGQNHRQQILPLAPGDILYVTARIPPFVTIARITHDPTMDAFMQLAIVRFPGAVRIVEQEEGQADVLAKRNVAKAVQDFLAQLNELCTSKG